MVNHPVFDDVPEMAVAEAFIIKGDSTEAVFVPHFHSVIAARTFGNNLIPDIKARQQFFAGGVNRRDAKLRRGIGFNRLRLMRLNHRHAQAAAL